MEDNQDAAAMIWAAIRHAALRGEAIVVSQRMLEEALARQRLERGLRKVDAIFRRQNEVPQIRPCRTCGKRIDLNSDDYYNTDGHPGVLCGSCLEAES